MVVLNGASGPENSIIYSGSKPVKNSFTSEELTSAINDPRWTYQPFQSCQVKVGNDGQIELSGKLIPAYLPGAKVYGFSDSELETGKDYLKKTLSEPPFYVNGKLSIENNKMNFDIDKTELGRANILSVVPADAVEGAFQRIVDSVPGLSVKNLDIQDGKFNFDGTIPDTVTVKQ